MPEIKEYKFTDRPPAGSSNIDILESTTDRFCEQLEEVIAKVVSSPAEVSCEGTKQQSFGDWIGSLASFESISTYRLIPLKGNLLVHLNEQMIAAFVDVYFGGTTERKNLREKPVFREIEETIIDRFCILLLEQFGRCFSAQTEFEAIHIGHESNPSYVDSIGFREQVACQKFIVTIGKLSWPITIIFGEEAIKSMAEFSSGQSENKSGPPDPMWQRQWKRNLNQVHLPLRTVLAQPVMTLPQLFQMKVNDVIPIMVKAKPPLFVANRKFATGTLGEQDGCSAYKIERIETGEFA
ncbi:hypothetical protein MNBD_ALPHA04-1929 [hydrothermal vent metagenome]|uniref:Flagellar motor switch protein FliM n=1 Tax=hydrothermal vent metagenome TaxID=652676 RepID=A0A3B0RM41_9ZZZZ